MSNPKYLLPWMALFTNGALAIITTCAQDNCYNAYTHSLTIASPFCSQYIESTSTVMVTPTVTILGTNTITPPPTGYPTIAPLSTNSQLSSRCNQDTDSNGVPSTTLSLRLSSACSCLGIVPSTVTTTLVAPATTTSIPVCAQDNCYNAFTHSLSIATPFCSQYIESTSTQTNTPVVTVCGTNTVTPPPGVYPTIPPLSTNSQLSSRCNQDTDANGVPSTTLSLRLSSACSCLGIVPLTVTTTIDGAPTTTTVAASSSIP